MKRSFIASLVACAVLFCAASVFYVLKEREEKEKLSLRSELSQASDHQKKLEADLHELQVSNSSFQERIKFQEDKISELAQSVEAVRAEREKAQAVVLEKESEIEKLRAQIQNAEREKRDLLSRLDKQYAEYYDMKFQLNSILKTKEELEKKARELAENGPVYLGTVIIRQNEGSK